MTPSPQTKAESDAATAAFHSAMIVLGLQAFAQSTTLWQSVPVQATQAAITTWLNAAVRLVMLRRKSGRDLGMAYYRYTRALETGYTVADPLKPRSPRVSIDQLRGDFEKQLPASVRYEPPSRASGDVDVESISGLAEAEATSERQVREEIKVALQAVGPAALQKKLTAKEDPAEAHKTGGNRTASQVARESMDGARGVIANVIRLDSRALGYIRISKTGTPCGFCAMLLSRGFVAKTSGEGLQETKYQSEKTATTRYSDGELYHPNCNCAAIAVYSESDLLTNPRFALNRQYGKEWPVVTKGLAGKQALSAWRKHIRTTPTPQTVPATAA